MPTAKPRVVIIGAGFAGLKAAKKLRRAPVTVTLIDRRNHHLFQPLLYQVATAALSPAEIAAPIRKVLRHQKNAEVILGEVTDISLEERQVRLADNTTVGFDYLIVATGATHSYLGNDDWREHAPGLKTIEDALDIRRRFLLAFENAERETNLDARRRALTFVVVGGGPTGVELAGTISEIARHSLKKDFRRCDPAEARVILVEAGPRLVPMLPEKCSDDAAKQLRELGVDVILDTFVTDIDEDGVQAGDDRIEAGNVIWAAGVEANELGRTLGAETDKPGHVKVNPDLTIPGHPNVFVAGDLAAVNDPESGKPVPGLAPAALQMGTYAAGVIRREVEAKQAGQAAPERRPFKYVDKGTLATIGRAKAVGDIRGWRPRGLVAWLLWAVVHVFYLITFRNRFAVMWQWIWTYFFFERGARLITGDDDLKVDRPAHGRNEPRSEPQSEASVRSEVAP